MVKHFIPSSLGEALSIMASGDVQAIAGGTDIMIQRRAPAGLPVKYTRDVIYLANLLELQYVKQEDGYIKIGAMTRLEDIIHSPLTPDPLRRIIIEMASPGIRHLATLAGNIANASPAGDSLIGLHALDAHIKLESTSGTRVVPIQKVITGVRKTTIGPSEIITEIDLPDRRFGIVFFKKVGGRQADAISKVSFIGLANVASGTITDIRVAFGAISPTVVRSKEIEARMIGKTIARIKADLPSIRLSYDQLIHPIDDQRSNASYRRKVALNLLTEMIEMLE